MRVASVNSFLCAESCLKSQIYEEITGNDEIQQLFFLNLCDLNNLHQNISKKLKYV